MYDFGRCSSELAQLVQLSYSQGRSACYSDRLHDFSVTIPPLLEVIKMPMSTVFFFTQLEFSAQRMLSFDL